MKKQITFCNNVEEHKENKTVNIFVATGNLTKDPELRSTKSGKSVCTFSVAVEGSGKNVSFVNFVAWETLAETVVRHLKKGSTVCVNGELRTRSYNDTTGKRVYVTEVVAKEIKFIGMSVVTPSDTDDFGEMPLDEELPAEFF